MVMTAGGKATEAISPDNITEVLRILKPDGHLLWTMKASQTENLIDLALQSLVKTGKCEIVKRETFNDRYTGTSGEFFMVRRLAGRFPDYLDRPTAPELTRQIEASLVDGADPTPFYDSWSDKYEDDLVIVGNYNGYVKCAEAFLQLGLDHKVGILDLAAGTGLLGRELTSKGYVTIDGLDKSLGMLGQARKQVGLLLLLLISSYSCSYSSYPHIPTPTPHILLLLLLFLISSYSCSYSSYPPTPVPTPLILLLLLLLLISSYSSYPPTPLPTPQILLLLLLLLLFL